MLLNHMPILANEWVAGASTDKRAEAAPNLSPRQPQGRSEALSGSQSAAPLRCAAGGGVRGLALGVARPATSGARAAQRGRGSAPARNGRRTSGQAGLNTNGGEARKACASPRAGGCPRGPRLGARSAPPAAASTPTTDRGSPPAAQLRARTCGWGVPARLIATSRSKGPACLTASGSVPADAPPRCATQPPRRAAHTTQRQQQHSPPLRARTRTRTPCGPCRGTLAPRSS